MNRTRQQDDDDKVHIDRRVPFSWLLATFAAVVLAAITGIFGAGMQWKAYQTLQANMLDMQSRQHIFDVFMSTQGATNATLNKGVDDLDHRVTILENKP